MAESFRAPGAETGLQGGLLADVAEEVVQDQGTLLNRLHSIYFDWMRLWSASQLEVRDHSSFAVFFCSERDELFFLHGFQNRLRFLV